MMIPDGPLVRVSMALLALVSFALAMGCESAPVPTPAPPPPGEVALSSLTRTTSPNVPGADASELVAGNKAFAFDVYQQVRGDDGNVFFSPYSISLALAMTYAGARGETEQEMADALHFTLAQDRLHPAFNDLDLQLAARGEGTADEDAGFRLNIVNRLWGQAGYEFLADYLDILAVNYGAGLSLLDFVSGPEESRLVINDWVSDVTEGRIENLIPPGAITPDTRLVLTNAIYFLGAWLHPFDEAATRDAPFDLVDGTEVTARMMTQQESFRYASGDGYQAVELPYVGNELAMFILVPDTGRFEAFESSLDAAGVDAMISELAYQELRLSMPRFTFSWQSSLTRILSDLGMPSAFGDQADFSGMDGTRNLAIQDVIHQAFVAVDEEATEAAAATAVVIGLTSVQTEQPLVLTIDRPFVFVIRDLETGTILFFGRVLDPTD
jgi:serpin B